MIEIGRVGEATRAFQRFVNGWDYSFLRSDARRFAAVPLEEREQYLADHEASSAYLQTYLGEWVMAGGGVEWTGGDFDVYARTALNIADCVMRGTVNCHYTGEDPYERPIMGIHCPDDGDSDFLERTGYAVAAYRWDRRNSGLLLEEPIDPVA